MKKEIDMPPQPAATAPAGVDLDDLKYIFFRHKWKIVLIFFASLAGAVGFFQLKPPRYQSEAKILIKYVLNQTPAATTPGSPGNQQVVSPVSPYAQAENVINGEVAILTTYDLAKEVASLFGPEKILAKAGGGTNLDAAARTIYNGLTVGTSKNSSIISIVFSHSDPAIVQSLLSLYLDTYRQWHKKLHEDVGELADFYNRQADSFRSRLAETDDEIKKLRNQSQILSVEESKTDYQTRKRRIEEELSQAEAELTEQRETLEAWKKLRPGKVETVAVEAGVPGEVADQYRTICAAIEYYQKRKIELAPRFTDVHPQLVAVNQKLSEAETQRKNLEQQYDKLVKLSPPPIAQPGRAEVDMTAQTLRVPALEAKIKFYTNELAKLRLEAAKIVDTEPEITKLMRRREMEESNLRIYTAGLEQTRINETSGAGKVTNIPDVQKPTPPSRDLKGLMKPLGMLGAFGLFGGFVLAFVLERFVNRRVKRVVDLERLVRSPVFVSVPDLDWKGDQLKKLLSNAEATTNGKPASLDGEAGHADENKLNGNTPSDHQEAVVATQRVDRAKVAPWDSRHILRSYYEGLRDRLITYFEVRNLTHKPKLVAVTSCRHGAGVTTMAAGLAATLSETGDGNVLLVDMNLEHGAAHQFYQGKPGCALTDALENNTRETAQVQENLYLVSVHETKNEKLPRALPKRFSHLIPRMKASDYDYIIFDMPPITQTSVTPRLAGLMDMVLLVVESETTGQEIVKRAHGLLGESRATVATVLNKHRDYIPERFSQEL